MVRIPVFLVLTGLIFAAISVAIDYARERFDSAPIQILSGHLEKTALARGDSLRVVLMVKRTRLCHTAVARYIHSSNGDVIAYHESIGGDAPVGTTRYAFTFPLPETIAPGRYGFKGVVASTCGMRRYIEVTPSLHFSVS